MKADKSKTKGETWSNMRECEVEAEKNEKELYYRNSWNIFRTYLYGIKCVGMYTVLHVL